MHTINTISGNLVDISNKHIYPATLFIENGIIKEIKQEANSFDTYILPGFVDAHIHIESSMLPPVEFARAAMPHGTVGVVSDPHEIANVLGINGIHYMLDNAALSPLTVCFGGPSCVPASPFENGGAVISAEDIDHLLSTKAMGYLAEMMNYPGIIHGFEEVMSKITIAKKHNKPIDGHAPGLKGSELERYIKAGITTEHEAVSYEEALEKMQKGMKILIREGSAAKNFNELIPLLNTNPDKCMFCSDDKHPDDLLAGHINELVRRAVKMGYDVMKVLKAACLNPVQHYKMDVGLLRPGDSADFIITNNLKDFSIINVIKKGIKVAEKGSFLFPYHHSEIINNFKLKKRKINEFNLPYDKGDINVIGVIDGQLITQKLTAKPKLEGNTVVSDPQNDVLKLCVINRYKKDSKPAIGFVKNIGLKQGAIGSSVAHDSHNIVVTGVDDASICTVVNALINTKGGICAYNNKTNTLKTLPLPIAGIMSDKPVEEVAASYSELDAMAKELGSTLSAPFMTLSFLALSVIPSLKLSDKGLFDSEAFEFISVFK
ncbi:adenine deaminase [Thermoproteota archaeon]